MTKIAQKYKQITVVMHKNVKDKSGFVLLELSDFLYVDFWTNVSMITKRNITDHQHKSVQNYLMDFMCAI